MGVLTKPEIEAYLQRNELLSNPRLVVGGNFDVQPDSYDLTAGKALWKDSKGNISRPLLFDPLLSPSRQETHSLQPGEMIFVITHEDVLMPKNLCGTVYTKNRLAMAGILALNAGHVDPGYRGPIVIRLINIRSEPWVIRMGMPIFTIVFQTLNNEVTDGRAPISEIAMLENVQESASNSLGNTLYDLYSSEVERRLLEYQSSVEERLRRVLAEEFIRRNDLWSVLLRSGWAKIATGIVFVAIVIGVLIATLSYLDVSPSSDSNGETGTAVDSTDPIDGTPGLQNE